MKSPFQFADDVRFTCSRCGDCCRTWNVMLGPGERQSLADLDWSGRADDLVGLASATQVSQPGGAARWRLRRRDDGSCIYLGAENQCRIQECFGAEKKPLLCRLYPFGFYPLGETIGVDVSFTCRAVAECSGQGLEAQLPEWTRLVQQSTTEHGVDRRHHRLKRKVALTGDLVWEFEHYLLGFVSSESLDLFGRIRCMLQFMVLGTTGDPRTPSAAKLREAMARGIPIQMQRQASTAEMDKTQRAIFFQWLFLCLNPPPFDLHDWPRDQLEAEKRRRIQAGKAYLHEKGKPWIDNRELGVTFQEIAAVGGDFLAGSELSAPLETFLKAKILGQRFMVVMEEELPLVEAVPKFLLAVPMSLWTAKALAAERGKERAEEEDLRTALRLVDRTLGTLPTRALPKKQARVCDYIMLETDLVEAAIHDLMRGHPDPSGA